MKKTTIFVLLLTFAAATTTNAADPNLVAWWKLDEGTGTIAHDSAGNNDGILTGNTLWVAGKIGSFALYFDGSGDNVDAPLSTTNSPITYTFWFKANSVAIHERIIERDWSSGGSFTSGVVGGKLQVIFRQSNGLMVGLESDPLSQDVWYHAACVFDGTNALLYVDGSLIASEPQTSLLADTRHIYIGAINYDFKGTIDDVRVYNRALSAEELLQLYQDSFPKGVELAIIKANAAIDEKIRALEIIDTALDKENEAIEALKKAVADKNLGDLTKNDVIKARLNIALAKVFENNSKKMINNSIDKLEDALENLGVEPPPPLDPNLISWWKLDEGAGSIAHDSAGNNDGILTGNIWVAGKIGSFALYFDGGGNNVDAPLTTANGPITYTFWFNPILTNENRTLERDWSHGGSFTSGMVSGKLQVIYRQSNETLVGMESAPLSPNVWYHAACVFDGANALLYVNGTLAASEPMTSIKADTRHIYIGGLYWQFKGTMDDIRVYNRALSAEEVLRLYQGSL